MADWYCLEITGECRNRFWHGPFPDKDTARGFAYSLYDASRMDLPLDFIHPGVINSEQRFFRRCWFGEGKIKYEGDYLYVFVGTGFEVFARDIDGNYQITDSEQEQQRTEADEETGEYCAGPMVDDWCEPCEGVTDVANTFNYTLFGEEEIFPDGGAEFIRNGTGSAPYLYESLVAPTQEEVDGVVSAFGGTQEDWISADGTNTLFVGFGYQRVARITELIGGFGVQYGYPATVQGEIWHVAEGDVEGFLAGGCPVTFKWLENADYLPWNPLAETFADPDIYLLGYNWKVELFAQIVSGGANYGSCFTARSQYDAAIYNQIELNGSYAAYLIPQTIHSGFVEAGGTLEVGREWWAQPGVFVHLPVGFRHTNDIDGKEIGDMVAPWAIAVNFQITPIFKAANGYNTCDIDLQGTTQGITVLARCPRESFQRPFMYAGIGTSTNPNFKPWPFTYGLFREEAGTPNEPVLKYKQELWGWSGNGLELWELLILNPTWALNVFIDNFPPFKRVPGYKKMVEFIRYLTGKRSQYQSIGTDPVTGWEVYPVPVIVGADGSGFPVYGEPVYRDVPAGGDNL